MINRRFKDAGLEPLPAYITLIVAFYSLSFYLFNKTEFAEYIYALSALTFTSKLSEVRRTEFLKLCFDDKNLKKIRIAENLTIALPFLVFFIYKQFFLSASILSALTIVLALLNFRTTLNFTIWTPFSKRPFEFAIGFRNTFYLILAAYTLTFIAVWKNNFNLGLFAMLLAFAITLSYYTKPENEFYVWIYSLNPEKFLFSKIKTSLIFSSFIVVPIASAIAIFFHQNLATISVSFFLGWAFLGYMIVAKYAAYPDELNVSQSILLALCIGFPFLLIVLVPYLFQKSKYRVSRLLK